MIKKHSGVFLTVLVIMLIICMAIAMVSGRYSVPLNKVIHILLGQFSNTDPTWTSVEEQWS